MPPTVPGALCPSRRGWGHLDAGAWLPASECLQRGAVGGTATHGTRTCLCPGCRCSQQPEPWVEPAVWRLLLSSSGLSLAGLGRLLLCAPYSLLVLPGKPSAFLGTGVTGMSLGHILKTQNLCYVASGRGHLTAWARIGALRTPLSWGL